MIQRTLLRLAALALAVWMPLLALAADPANPAALRLHPGKAAFPELLLSDTKSRGQRAVDLLGASLPSVAAFYGKTSDEFRTLLVRDQHLRVDQRGRLFVEDGLEGALPDLTAAERSVLDGTLLPDDQTFLLHSRPGAKRTIYLNFKGATIAGTAWNTGGVALTAQPFDLDGIPNTFSSAELQRIQGIWQRVAEDFAPFDVDVTTELPSPDRLTRSSSSDQVFGTTVVVTKTAGVYSCSCGGVAYVSAFDDTSDYYKPALVFYDRLSNGNEKFVADAISHEAGHNMGLLHDGWAGGAYYSGHGTGLTGWAPIMGTGYNKALVQWSKGQYTGANNTQDDYVVMEANGLPIRLDDHGDTIGTATALTGTTAGGISNLAVQGVIERPTDVDMFSFAASAGSATITLTPAAREPNLDAQIQLLNAAGTVLATANPVDALNASISFNLPAAGTYYVSVQGVGMGDPLTTGYTNYGSLGNYLLAVTAPAGAGNQAPVAAMTATPTTGVAPLTVAFSAAGSTDADGSIASYQWTFGDGTTGTGATASHVYSTPGSYTAQLRVVDNLGLSSTRTVPITVNAAAAGPSIKVSIIAMSLSTVGGRTSAVAAMKVVDANGVGVPGATVSISWSGLATGTAVLNSNSLGNLTFVSPSTTASGTFVFTVTNVVRSGYSYNPALNVETSDSISTGAAANQPPVAVLTATPASGTAPLTVVFSAAGSTDADGSIASYEWTFGDGTTGTGLTTNHVYTAAGSYTAQLRVVDNLGLSATKTVPISVSGGVAGGPAIRVSAIAMNLSLAGGLASGIAYVKVVDANGVGVSGATVTGTWSGAVTGTTTLTSNSIGNLTFVSAPTAAFGTFTFTVTQVVRSGYTYNPALNTETSDSITR